jgi:hypothetical protein
MSLKARYFCASIYLTALCVLVYWSQHGFWLPFIGLVNFITGNLQQTKQLKINALEVSKAIAVLSGAGVFMSIYAQTPIAPNIAFIWPWYLVLSFWLLGNSMLMINYLERTDRNKTSLPASS